MAVFCSTIPALCDSAWFDSSYSNDDPNLLETLEAQVTLSPFSTIINANIITSLIIFKIV